MIQTDNLVVRIGATLVASGWATAGLFAINASFDAPTPELADRAWWMGITFVLAAVIALPVSWLVADLSNIWCVAPRRAPPPRLILEDNNVEDRERDR